MRNLHLEDPFEGRNKEARENEDLIEERNMEIAEFVEDDVEQKSKMIADFLEDDVEH